MLSNQSCRWQLVGGPRLRSILRAPNSTHSLHPSAHQDGGWEEWVRQGWGFRSTHRDSLSSLLGQHWLYPQLSPKSQAHAFAQVLQPQRTQAVSLMLRCLPGSSLQPQEEISSEEYQSIDMGPDSLSEQNTKAASLLSVSCRTTSLLPLGLIFLMLLAWALGWTLRFPGLYSARVGGMQRECCSGKGWRQAEKWKENWRESSDDASSCPAVVDTYETSFLLLPLTIPYSWESCCPPFHKLTWMLTDRLACWAHHLLLLLSQHLFEVSHSSIHFLLFALLVSPWVPHECLGY